MAKALLVLLAVSQAVGLFSTGGPEGSLDGPDLLFAEDEGEAFATDASLNLFDIDVAGSAFLQSVELQGGDLLKIDSPTAFMAENQTATWSEYVSWEDTRTAFRINMGREWESDVNSRLLPGIVDAGSGYYSSNFGRRRTPFRTTRFVAFSDAVQITLQGSFHPNQIVDLPFDRDIGGQLSDLPQIQGRLDMTLGIAARSVHRPSWALQATSVLDFVEGIPPPLSVPQVDAYFETWSASVNLHIPVSASFGCQGQFFTTIYSRLQGPIHSTGGWCTIWNDWTPRLHSHVGLGIDDMVDHDTFPGRTLQHFVVASLSFDITDHVATGVEVAYRESKCQGSGVGPLLSDRIIRSEPQRVVVIDWMLVCSF